MTPTASCRREARADRQGVVELAPLLWQGDVPGAERQFAAAYQARFGRPPPPGAVGLYAAVRHLLEAIEEAGLDREAIRAALHDKNKP